MNENRSTSDNKDVIEIHGCIVCARVYTILAVYAPDGGLVGCTVTSSGGHCLANVERPLVACNTHSTQEIDAAYKRWLARNKKNIGADVEDE